MGGIPFPGGYCNYIEEGAGGSFSNDCAHLNDDPFDWLYRHWMLVAGGVAVCGVGYAGYKYSAKK